MAAPVADCDTQRVNLAGTTLQVLTGGGGQPCVVLHGIEGDEGWLAFHAALAEQMTVYAPSLPGYGHTDAPDWISSVLHEAVFCNWFLGRAGLSAVTLVGIGLGGWIAAEMAVMCTARLSRLVLVNPGGLKARDDLIDIFVERWSDVLRKSFFSAEQSDEYQRVYGGGVAEFGGIRETGRTMTTRLCYRPYLYDPALEGMLPKIDIPTLVIGADNDRIVPAEAVDRFSRAIPGAIKRTIERCGHFAHMERPRDLAKMISEVL